MKNHIIMASPAKTSTINHHGNSDLAHFLVVFSIVLLVSGMSTELVSFPFSEDSGASSVGVSVTVSVMVVAITSAGASLSAVIWLISRVDGVAMVFSGVGSG